MSIAALALSVSTSATGASLAGGAAPLDLHLGRIAAALLIGALLALAIALLLRRYGPLRTLPLLKMPQRAVRVLESQQISAQANVCRLSYDGREYVVVVSPGAATVLASRDANEAPP